MSGRRRYAGNVRAAGPLHARVGSRDSELSSPSQLAVSEPLEAIYLPDAPLNIRAALLNLILMGAVSAAFIGAALFVDFISTFIEFP
jgi:hypothetical protein